MTTTYHIFTDGSATPRSKQGVGAYFITTTLQASLEDLGSRIQTKQFENTSSTQLELETLLWALKTLEPALIKCSTKARLYCYTDCNNIIGLPKRQNNLEKKQYLNAQGSQIRNHLLYKSFFNFTNQYTTNFVKVAGHQPSHRKDFIAEAFTLVDKASRKALRGIT